MIKKRIIYWVAGTSLAFGGVLVVRVMSQPLAGSSKLYALISGYTISILGLFLITLGTRRKG